MALSRRGTCRASDSNSAKVCSATLTAFPPGVLMTKTPRRVASSRSMLSTPTPARPITRSRGAFSNSSGVTLVALRTIKASASAICAWSVSLVVRTMFHPALRSSSTPRSLILSATITFIDGDSSLMARVTLGAKWGAKCKQITVATCSHGVKSVRDSDGHPPCMARRSPVLFLRLFCYIRGHEDRNESCREDSERLDRRDARERGIEVERAADGEIGDYLQRDGKAAQAGRRGVHPIAANAGEAAQGIDRAIREGRPPGPGRQRDEGVGDH